MISKQMMKQSLRIGFQFENNYFLTFYYDFFKHMEKSWELYSEH